MLMAIIATEKTEKTETPWHVYFSLSFACVSALGALINVYFLLKINNNSKAIINKLKSESSFISFPKDNSTVGAVGAVRGLGRFSGLNNYIVITSLSNGVHYLQDGVIPPTEDWNMHAKFGEARSCGIEFEIRVIGVSSEEDLPKLKYGLEFKNDWLYSKPVFVKREPCQ
jgi:hypothetical protein